MFVSVWYALTVQLFIFPPRLPQPDSWTAASHITVANDVYVNIFIRFFSFLKTTPCIAERFQFLFSIKVPFRRETIEFMLFGVFWIAVTVTRRRERSQPTGEARSHAGVSSRRRVRRAERRPEGDHVCVQKKTTCGAFEGKIPSARQAS